MNALYKINAFIIFIYILLLLLLLLLFTAWKLARGIGGMDGRQKDIELGNIEDQIVTGDLCR